MKSGPERMLTDEEFRAFLKTLGARVRFIRKQKGLKLREIMIATGYYDAQWRKYESGGSLNVASLMKIALALDVSLGDLLDGLTQWPKLNVAQIQGQHLLSALPRGTVSTTVESTKAGTSQVSETIPEAGRTAKENPSKLPRRKSKPRGNKSKIPLSDK